MSSTELGITHGLPRLRLREICKRRLLEEMVSHALRNGEPTPIEEFAADADGRGRPYLVLVADALTLRMVNSVCQISDLLTESVWGVQCIDAGRQPLPVLEALYFIAPTTANVEQLMQDVLDRKPKYRGFHVFFSHKLGDEQLRCVAKSKEVVSRLLSFAELNLSFLAHDDRTFHLGDSRALAAVLKGLPPEADALSEAACRLSTLLVCLPSRPSVHYATRSAGASASAGSGVCERLSVEVLARLDEMESKGVQWPQSPRAAACTLLIVDRSVDWVPLLLHDMAYEALLHDVLGSSCVSTEEGRFTHVEREGGAEQQRTVVLGDVRDALWEKCRHSPIWEVNDLVAAETRTWTERDEELRRVPAASNISHRVSTTLNTLQSLPEHKERFDWLQVHADICHRCLGAIEAQKLVDIGALEQDLATGVSAEGGRRNSKAVEKELVQYLADPQLDGEVKARLLLLFLSSSEGASCQASRRLELAAHLAAQDRELLLRAPWLAAPRGEQRDAAEKRRQTPERGNAGSPRRKRLRRWRPRLQRLVEELVRGALDAREFPELRRRRSSSSIGVRPGSTGGTAPAQARAVVVFVVGGVALSEVRAAHDAARALGTEVFVGGSCLLTPAALMAGLRGS